MFTGAQALLALQERTQRATGTPTRMVAHAHGGAAPDGPADEFEMVASGLLRVLRSVAAVLGQPPMRLQRRFHPEVAPAAPRPRTWCSAALERQHHPGAASRVLTIRCRAGRAAGHIEGRRHPPARRHALEDQCQQASRWPSRATSSSASTSPLRARCSTGRPSSRPRGAKCSSHNLHRLVAVLFNVLGVNEHAWVAAKKLAYSPGPAGPPLSRNRCAIGGTHPAGRAALARSPGPVRASQGGVFGERGINGKQTCNGGLAPPPSAL